MSRKRKKDAEFILPLSADMDEKGPPSCSRPASGSKNEFTRYYHLAWIPVLILLLAVPWAWVKVLLACALIVLVSSVKGWSRSQGMVALGSLFAFAYLFSPYWLIPSGAERHDLAKLIGDFPARFFTLACLLSVGTIWAWLAADQIPGIAKNGALPNAAPSSAPFGGAARKRRTDWVIWGAPAILAVVILALNCGALYNDIPAGGDEIFHIGRLNVLRRMLTPLFAEPALPVTILCALAAGVFVIWPRRMPGPLKLLILCIAGGVVAFLFSGFKDRYFLEQYVNRYPFVSSWLHLIGPAWTQNALNEGLCRLVPLVSVFALAWFVFRTLAAQGIHWSVGIIGGLLVVLAPNVRYYGTILYLELPAAALVAMALYHVETLVLEDFPAVRRHPAWYALLAAGFIKETLFPIVFGIIGFRLLARAILMTRRRQWSLRAVGQEIAACFCLAIPMGIYLMFRMYFSSTRGYAFSPGNFWNGLLWQIVIRQLGVQFGGLLLLALGGLIVGLWQRRFLWVGMILSLGVAQFLFHFLETSDYADTARFYLMLLAPVIALMIELLAWIGRANRPIQAAGALIIVIGLIVNVALSPVTLSGDKVPNWASSMCACETWFPFSKAVAWLKENRPNTKVMVGGAPYDTCLASYFYNAQHRALDDRDTVKIQAGTPYLQGLKATIEQARKKGYSLVLFYKMEGDPRLTEDQQSVLGYKAVAVIANTYRALVVYELQAPGANAAISRKTK